MLIIEKNGKRMDKCFVAYDSLNESSFTRRVGSMLKTRYSKPNLEFYKTFQSEFSSNQK